MRLLWVVPRFGRGIVGGAETLVRGLATHAPDDWTVEVATTCAVDHVTWANQLAPGTTIEDGTTVHRFPVGDRDSGRYARLHRLIADGTATYADEVEWFSQSVWAPGLDDFLDERGCDYDLIALSPYLFGTTVWGANVHPDRTVLMPCLHDEPYAHLETTRRMFGLVRGFIFNSPPEQELARRLYGASDGFVVGMGFDPPAEPPPTGFAAAHELGQYVLYAGRIEEGKRVDVAVEYAVRYARERPGAPKLALIGSGPYRVPLPAQDVVRRVGVVDESERRAAYREAVALVNPSHLESLSLVVLEAWLEETPAIVAAGSDVLRYHSERSGGGFVFHSYDDYRDSLDQLLDNPQLRETMGRAGKAYVIDSYGWPAVSERLRSAAESLAA